jgi:putative membrane protein insertion efficiency factor
MNKVFIFPFIVIIKFYQTFISPLLGSNCRFQPTCSEYCMDSLKTWGLLKGLYLSVKRIMKCHPWGGKGYDPVPRKD